MHFKITMQFFCIHVLSFSINKTPTAAVSLWVWNLSEFDFVFLKVFGLINCIEYCDYFNRDLGPVCRILRRRRFAWFKLGNNVLSSFWFLLSFHNIIMYQIKPNIQEIFTDKLQITCDYYRKKFKKTGYVIQAKLSTKNHSSYLLTQVVWRTSCIRNCFII